MKSYKQINDEIHASKPLQQTTVQAMLSRKQRDKKRYVAIGVICIMMMVLGSMIMRPAIKEHAQTSSSKAFALSTYISKDNVEAKTIGIGKIAGDFQTLDIAGEKGELNLNAYELEGITMNSSLKVPPNYTSTQNFETWTYEEQGPYPSITYDFQKEDYYYSATIQDKRIPECIEENHSYKKYKGYELCVYRQEVNKNAIRYRAYAIKKNYRYEVHAMAESDDDFEAFLLSFLK